MNDSQESSYYEVSLTNRQVLVSFVVVLILLLMVFVFGAWLGRRSCVSVGVDGTGGPPLVGDASDSSLDGLEPFGGESNKDEVLDKPDLSQLAETPRTETTLAQDLGEEPVARDEPAPPVRTPPPPPSSSPPPPRTVTPPPPTTAPPPPVAPPAVTSAEPTTGYIIQVLSSRDRSKAEGILGQLRAGGHRAYLSPRESNGVTMFRVRIGPFDDKAEAERLEPEIKRTYRVETWVTTAEH